MSEQPFDKTQGEPLARKKCIPCEGGTPPLTPEEAKKLMPELDQEWMLIDGSRILARTFAFKDFAEALAFVNKVGVVAEAEGHHPDITLSWGSVGVELTTHAIGGLSENDFIVAAKIDELQA
jgi:4a-hydroxytetrahydrobiopterin dehydratase